jgi:hypothetical protein
MNKNHKQVNKKHKQVNNFFFKIFANGCAMVAGGKTKLFKNNLKVMKVSNRWNQDSLLH